MQNAKQIAKGCYPTMITPYRDGEIDYAAVDRLVDWYLENDCDGIFAVCQSSEMAFLSLRERLQLAERVVRRVDGRISVVVGGHVSNSILDQAEEVNALAQVGADAVVLVTNRFDIANDGDDAWIANGEKLLSLIKDDVRLGLYECPMPYKRLLTEKTLEWCINTGRFGFIKDTCCDPVLLQQRIQRLEGTGLLLYNANQQTLLESLRCGGAGYCGIMANFVPKAISWV
ncbi:MAG: dihydrodipicolinate synthase family protein, partial [Clostridia bacterium]|nr:dihydrodipicolinate synthase family protein [Clostridia bacterium]